MAPKALSVVRSSDETYLEDLKKKFTLSQDLCEPARKEWTIDQSYYDGPGQWTPGEREILRARHQPDTYFNDVKPAVNGMIGTAERGKTDPRAYGRSPKDADAADVATDCLRYIKDVNLFGYLESQARKDHLVQGVACFVTEIDPANKDVKIVKGRPEAFFYDPYSREPDFSDARYLGLANWMDEDDALALVDDDDPKAEDKRRNVKHSIDAMGLSPNESYKDRPEDGWSWADKKNRRLMVVQMWHRKGQVWHMCKFVGGGILEQGESPYKDADGKPRCQLRAQSCYVDGENRRYGVVRDMRGPQDAQNKGWSKALHIISVAKLRVDPGTQDVDTVRREWAKPDGIIQARKDAIEELGDKQLLPAHIEMLQIAESKMRRQSPTPASVGRQQSQSGRAQLVEQEAGATEQAPVMGNFDHLIMMVYRDCWATVKQFWTEPKYIRVTDDENAPKYIMMNEPAVVMGPDGQPVIGPDGKPQIDPRQPPRNAPAQMDVDIIIDKEKDTAVIAEEQFTVMGQIETARPGTFSPQMLIKMSSLPRKREILDAMKAEAEEAAQQPKQPGPEEIEKAKAAVQLEANNKRNEQDLAANDAKLDRADQADAAKVARAQKLEDYKLDMKRRDLEAQNQHAERQAKMNFSFKQKEQRAQKAADNGEQPPIEDDEDMNGISIQMPPEIAQALADHVAQKATAASESKVASQEASMKAAEAVPAALLEAANAIRESTQLQAEVARQTLRILMAPKKLVRDADGQKMAVTVFDNTTVQ